MIVVVQDSLTKNVLSVEEVIEAEVSALSKGDKFKEFSVLGTIKKKNSIILLVEHEEKGKDNAGKAYFLNYLQTIIESRQHHPEENKNSYTVKLFEKGINKIAQKVGEEAVEVVIEALDNNKKLLIEESSDLLFHFLVLLQSRDVELDEVIDKLRERHN